VTKMQALKLHNFESKRKMLVHFKKTFGDRIVVRLKRSDYKTKANEAEKYCNERNLTYVTDSDMRRWYFNNLDEAMLFKLRFY